MKISRFAHYLSKLEATTKRLEITAILSEMLTKLDESEAGNAIYLSLGQLGPLFAQTQFALAEKMMLRIISQAFQASEEKVNALYSKEGDLGNISQALAEENGAKKSSDLSINEVYSKLLEIAEISGTGSQDKKISKFSELLSKLDPLSARYLARVPTGNTRLGFSDVTIIEALSWMEKGDKSLKTEIESYFHVYPDIGRITQLFKKGGLKALKEIDLEVGVPVLPQLCQRVSTAEEAIEKMGGKAGAEYKFDGTRVQLHMDKKRKTEGSTDAQLAFFESKKEIPFVKTFTRNLEESTTMFPDLIKAALEDIDAQSVILDGEAVGYDPKTGKLIPFQETSQRKRKHEIMEKVSEIPLKYFVFDLLYLNGKSIMNEPFSERRGMLSEILKKNSKTILMDDQKIIEGPETLTKTFKMAKEKGLEGIVIKKLDSRYEAGGRGFAWVKFKREETGGLEDTVDAVIMGYYFGRGARAQFGIGGFLVGVYDKKEDKYATISKVGSGPTEEEWMEIKKRADKNASKEMPANYLVSKTLKCDVWAKPKEVVVIRADEITVSEVHSAGYALRFPRLMQFRSDKRPEDTTSVSEIKHLYDLQKKG